MSGVVARLTQPPGARSTIRAQGLPGQGGEWIPCRDRSGTGGSFFAAELAACLKGSRPIDMALLRAEVRNKMLRASRGLLQFGPDGEVDQMQICPRVLEIRVGSVRAPGLHVHVRLYFTEPDHDRGVLLYLLLASKSPDEFWKQEQNDHARVADWRIDSHYGLHGANMTSES